jgi:LPXTG-motif cell wall-anchored protein
MPEENKEKTSFFKALGLAWEMGYIIAVPLVILAVIGRLLDRKLSSSPILLLIGILLAMVISGVLVFRRTKRIMDEVKK